MKPFIQKYVLFAFYTPRCEGWEDPDESGGEGGGRGDRDGEYM